MDGFNFVTQSRKNHFQRIELFLLQQDIFVVFLLVMLVVQLSHIVIQDKER